MIIRLLVANRGEIARRIFRTCAEMGIGTVAVYEADDDDHLDYADMAVRVRSYLDVDELVRAAESAGAQAVHPGYGFLSENAAFARAVIGAGLVWIGPPPEAIEAMGSKTEAKKLMAAAGVPVLPEFAVAEVPARSEAGAAGATAWSEAGGDGSGPLGKAAAGGASVVSEVDVAFPLVVKASAGGGGRGMRVVREPAALERALAEARAEAEAAFGDAAVFVEPYLEDARHIEVQVLADAHGRIWTLGERECSLQRRHQKVVEESPSPFVTPALRESLCAAAVKAAQAVGYVNAGTVEFLVDGSGRFSFLEMNTRLQVEHPVTEAVTGLDLVRWQILIAAGATLEGDAPVPRGHAIEARLYAEDPRNGWLPQAGTLRRFAVPALPGVRVDAGVDDGSRVGVRYDPMLAKVIAHAPTRDEAGAKLAAALAGARIHGLRTNRDHLVRTLRHPAFVAGQTTTAFFERHDLSTVLDETPFRVAAARAVAALSRTAGWRNVRSQPRRKFGVEYVTHPSDRPDRIVQEIEGVRHVFHVAIYEDVVELDSSFGSLALPKESRFPQPGVTEVARGSLIAPMPGIVSRIGAMPGKKVLAGQPILWLEAMKMEHPIVARSDGVVTAIHAQAGQQVEVGQPLATVEEE
ncbi:biotin carboxylase N-terminal domain-containing protein [Allorhizocola rhizosphaerae]|uniref:acetyl/propionyl/methylcrotonyl-CoA carboxylase subunit alpha n=1 Tax=Allorhizocola rhizosphaerae TaxID=1872709 RepID=UPI000E3DA659